MTANSEINLLPGQNVFLSQERLWSRRAGVVTIVTTVATVVILIAGLLAKQITASQISGLEASYKKGLDNYNLQQEKANNLWNLEAKVTGIAEVRQTRADLTNQAASLAELVSNGITMDRASLGSGGQTTAVLRADNISSFNSLLDYLAKPNRNGTFSNVTISGLDIDPNQVVSLTFSGKYGKD